MPSYSTAPGDQPAARPSRTARVLAVVVFLGLIVTPLAVQRFSQASSSNQRSFGMEDAITRYGFAFEEVSAEMGIRFTHEAPELDAKLEPIMPAVAAYGAAVSVTDFDRDGWQDLYVTTSAIDGANALFRNRGDGTFEDVAPRMGVALVNRAASGASMGTVWGDYDNDGYEDLFLYKWGQPELYHNDEGRGFTRVTTRANLPEWINANTAVWFDYDRDGWLDLFVGAFYPEDLNLWSLANTRMMPESFEFAQNGGRNYLFHNRGDGSFDEVSEAAGLTARRWTLAAAAADVDRDGDPDLFVANDYGINELYLNDGTGKFREVGRAANVARTPKSGMNASFGDVLNRGEWAIFVTNISEPGVLIHGNDLWVPTHEPGDTPTYRNLAGALGVELGGFAFGAQFGDLNNDGWLDLFVTSGLYSGDPSESYWYDYSLVAGGNRTIIADARNWPPMRGRSLSGYQPDHVWLNDGAGRFNDVTSVVGVVNSYDGRAVALADLGNRGALDAIVAYQRGPLQVFRNHVRPDNGWIAFALMGTLSNRSAIGAEVHLFWGGMEQIQQIEGGNGFAAQNQRRAHFGLGAATAVDSAVIRWPSGITQTIAAPEINRLHRVGEPG